MRGRVLAPVTLVMLVVLVVALVAVAVIAGIAFDPGIAAVLVMILLVGSLLLVQQRRLSSRLQRALRQLHDAQRSDRKDASRWEWNILQAIKSEGGQAGATGQAPIPAGQLAVDVAALARAGIFDRAHYEAMQRQSFSDDASAMEHFATVGMPALVGPSTLLDPARLPVSVRDAYAVGDIAALITFLKLPLATMPPLSEFFSPSMVEASDAETTAHPGGCLGWFLERTHDNDLLPSREVHARWWQFQNATREVLAEHRRAWRVHEPRTSADWDAEAENRWKAEVSSGTVCNRLGGAVSVIMPVWNRADVVGDAIASVVRQEFADWELIVVDDGSEDDTPNVLRTIAADDPRIRVVTVPHGGVAAARNRGLKEAGGELVAFLDADNRWRPDFLRLASTAIRRDSLSAAYAGVAVHTKSEVRYRAFDGGRDELLSFNHIDLNVLVTERGLVAAVGGFDESLRRWVDHDFVLRLSTQREPVLLPFIACDSDDTEDDRRISRRESDEWEWVVLDKAWSDWERADASEVNRVPGRVSVVIPTKDDVTMTVRAVRAVCAKSRDAEVEVVIVDNGSSVQARTQLAGMLCGEPRSRIVPIHRNLNFAIGSNVGFTHSTGQHVLFLNNDTVVREGWLEPLLDALHVPEVLGVQSLLVYPDESIQSAGTVWVSPDGLPVHFLAQHPPEDAAGTGAHAFPAITAAAALFRAADVLAVRGFDPRYRNGMEDADLCLRLSEAKRGSFRVAPESVVEHAEGSTPGRKASTIANRRLFLDRWRGRMPQPSREIFAAHRLIVERVEHDSMEVPSPRPLIVRDRRSAPRRWGIRHAAVGGGDGDRWGDTAFANSLADALRRLGQEVVTYRHGPNTATQGIHDDVSLVLRGLDRVEPLRGAINILWVISHPNAVTDVELGEYELVYAASDHWAQHRSASSGREVRTLLQCTDAKRFAPWGGEWPLRPTTFVGSVHPGRRRRVVADALAAGIDLRVIGEGWQRTLPPQLLESDHVAQDKLASVYGSSFRVLADHWTPMAAEGFIQNRIFDAVAAGAPVVSDPVEGIDEVFGDAVATYRTPEELAALCLAGADHPAGDAMARAALAERIRTEHSFDARARELVAAVEAIEHREISANR